MHRDGHLGVALLAYAPLGGTLAHRGRPGLAAGLVVVVLATARLPDYDQWLPGLCHRGATHSLPFALAVGTAAAVAAQPVVDVAAGPDGGLAVAGSARGGVRRWVGGASVVAVLSHLVADAVTADGVVPFWPLSRRRVALGLVAADHPWANTLAFHAGVAATAAWVGPAL